MRSATKRLTPWIIAGPVLILSSSSYGAEPPLSADRPGFSDSTSVVPLGHFAVELGVGFAGAFEQLSGAVASFPEARIRVGLPGPFEAIVLTPAVVIDGSMGVREPNVGTSDPGFGAKFATDAFGFASFSTVALVFVPLSVNDFGSDTAAGFLGLNLDVPLSDLFTLTVAGYGSYAEDALQLGVGSLFSVGLGDVGLFAEAFVERAEDGSTDLPANPSAVSLGVGGGVTYMVNEQLQLDAFIDFFPWSEGELSVSSSAFAGGFGLSFIL